MICRTGKIPVVGEGEIRLFCDNQMTLNSNVRAKMINSAKFATKFLQRQVVPL